MKLADVFRDAGEHRIVGNPHLAVSSLSYRSTLAGPGHLFFCVPGFVHDGHDYARDAVSNGAVALCVERLLDLDVAQVVVPSVRRAMGPAAAALFEHPSARLATVGITGTNGKTTSTFLTAFLLDDQGRRAGLLGTVERRIGGERFPAERTTPEAIDVQQDLAMMVDVGDQAAVLEVSSHALDMGRAAGLTFSAVAFTNLTQDHLDYHGDIESYFGAKSRLFLDPAFARNRPTAVINVSDPFGRVLAERLTPDRLLTFAAPTPAAVEPGGTDAGVTGNGVVLGGDAPGGGWDAAMPADLAVRDVVMDSKGTRGVLVAAGRAAAAIRLNEGAPVRKGETIETEFRTRLVGDFNVANLLTALGIGIALGLEFEPMVAAVDRFSGVPGRMERVDGGESFTVVVDYAHTPDSVRNVLTTARRLTDGRLIGLLGCGGDRDRGKRPQMARALEEGTDLAVVTSDNPRSEEPEDIIDDMLGGLERPEAAVVEVDRLLAIRRAIRSARPGDIVLILGKGHESGQEFRDRVLPFDDRQVAREVLAELRGEGR